MQPRGDSDARGAPWPADAQRCAVFVLALAPLTRPQARRRRSPPRRPCSTSTTTSASTCTGELGRPRAPRAPSDAPDPSLHSRRSRPSVAAAPQILLEALAKRSELRGVELMHLHLELPNPCAAPELKDSFFINNLFVGANMRQAVNEGRSSYVPLFLSEVPVSMRQGYLRWARSSSPGLNSILTKRQF